MGSSHGVPDALIGTHDIVHEITSYRGSPLTRVNQDIYDFSALFYRLERGAGRPEHRIWLVGVAALNEIHGRLVICLNLYTQILSEFQVLKNRHIPES